MGRDDKGKSIIEKFTETVRSLADSAAGALKAEEPPKTDEVSAAYMPLTAEGLVSDPLLVPPVAAQPARKKHAARKAGERGGARTAKKSRSRKAKRSANKSAPSRSRKTAKKSAAARAARGAAKVAKGKIGRGGMKRAAKAARKSGRK